MQMRFDGNLGFPGGLMDKTGEKPVDALNREMNEEIKLDLTKHAFTQKHHLVTHVNQSKKLITHFYTMEVQKQEYEAIEKNVLDADEYGIEVSLDSWNSLA